MTRSLRACALLSVSVCPDPDPRAPAPRTRPRRVPDDVRAIAPCAAAAIPLPSPWAYALCENSDLRVAGARVARVRRGGDTKPLRSFPRREQLRLRSPRMPPPRTPSTSANGDSIPARLLPTVDAAVVAGAPPAKPVNAPAEAIPAPPVRERLVDALSVVHRVDLLLELLRRRLPLHLHGRRQLAALLREVAIENGEPLDRLVRGHRGVHPIDRVLDLLPQDRAARRVRVAAGAGELLRVRLYHGDEHGHVLAPVADHDDLADQVAARL